MTMATVSATPVQVGKGIPADVPHAVSVSLPRWQDNVDYEEGRLADTMETGYPRFFIHRSIGKLAAHLSHKFARPNESCILVRTSKIADACRAFMQDQAAKQDQHLTVRVVQFCLVPPSDADPKAAQPSDPCSAPDRISIYVVLFPKESFPLAKAFWQHTGDGISSRLAETCLQILKGAAGGSSATPANGTSGPSSSRPGFRNRHYSRRNTTADSNDASDALETDKVMLEHSIYVEERYGRNLPLSSASLAKQALRRRIAGTLPADRSDQESRPYEESLIEKQAETSRTGTNVGEENVYLYPTGMSAIFHAHQIAMLERRNLNQPIGKSVCFGFPYTDTLKILQKWGPGCHHLGNGTDAELEDLEQILEHRTEPRITALMCEFPSNPLLRSPNLPRLRQLADKYDFLLIIDETIGNFVNVEVLPYADMVVSSLTKVFSGDTNVMGGSLVLNPNARPSLRAALEQDYEDTYWEEDAIYMERNSRDFIPRVHRINMNAEDLCEVLREETLRPVQERVIAAVQYPKYETFENYEFCRRKTPLIPGTDVSGGYGGLFSIFFTSEPAAIAFYDALNCAKGPSLGTNFTLASPYAILAHYTELEWAAQFGVPKSLVRVSVGLEKSRDLVAMFLNAADAARRAIVSQ